MISIVDNVLTSPFLWIVLTTGLYLLAGKLKERWANPIFTPLVFTIIVIILVLLISNVSLKTYNSGGQFFSLFVTPATVALAIKVEKNFEYLKKYYISILSGIVSGIIFHTIMIYISALLFQFDWRMVATLIPKSITTAIAVSVSQSLGGISSLTVAVVVFNGVIGAVVGQTVFQIFNIDDPVAQGVALGSSSHAVGTAKAIEMGNVQGAMSGLSIVFSGLIVVVLVSLIEPFTFFFR